MNDQALNSQSADQPQISSSTAPPLDAESHPQPAALKSSPNWWRIADFAVLGLWIAVTSFTLSHHEKWADEAQAWLLARDLPLSTLWLHELRYEGSPGLWHTILWVAQHVFHAPYAALGPLGLGFAFVGIVYLVLATPFPRPLRWLMAFSFFFLYQYAVIARSYVLFALFCFIAAQQYRNGERPLRFAAALAPLALLTAHGSLLAAGLALAYAIRFVQHWRDHNQAARREFWVAAALLAVLYVCLLLVLFPPPDVEATHSEVKLTAAVAAHRMVRGVQEALVDNPSLSLLILVIFAGWCSLRSALTSFLVPIALVLALYVYADGWEHQAGTIFLAILAGLAIAWPDAAERGRFDGPMRLAYRAMVATLTATLLYQVYAAFYTIRRDVRFPYSGAEDTAKYLRPFVAQGKVIEGAQYGMVAINAYFDHNIFRNRPHAFYHHSLAEFDPNEIRQLATTGQADFLVMQWWPQWDPQLYEEGLAGPMQHWGYVLDHVSDGYLLTKTGYSHRQIYLTFRHVQPGAD